MLFFFGNTKGGPVFASFRKYLFNRVRGVSRLPGQELGIWLCCYDNDLEAGPARQRVNFLFQINLA